MENTNNIADILRAIVNACCLGVPGTFEKLYRNLEPILVKFDNPACSASAVQQSAAERRFLVTAANSSKLCHSSAQNKCTFVKEMLPTTVLMLGGVELLWWDDFNVI